MGANDRVNDDNLNPIRLKMSAVLFSIVRPCNMVHDNISNPLIHVPLKPKEVRHLSGKSIGRKIVEGSMLLKTLPTSLLQIFW